MPIDARHPKEIRADILAIEKEAEGLMLLDEGRLALGFLVVER